MNPLDNLNSAPKAETPAQKPAEKKLTPEQLQQNILDEVLKKYWVDLREHCKETTVCNLETLKTELNQPPSEKLKEQKARDLYREYLEKKMWEEGGIEKTVNLNSIVDSLESERLTDMKNEFDKIIDKVLGKYDFLDNQTKNFVKLGIVNSMLKSQMWQVWDSLMWSFGKFTADLSQMDTQNIDSWLENINKNPKDSGRSLSLEEQFTTKIKSYTDKFEAINTKLNWKTSNEKQNIISHIDWFRNPALIEAWVDWLNLSQLNINNKDKKNETLDTKALVEYTMNSREDMLNLSKKLQLWDKVGNTLYGLLNNGGKIWEWVQKILEIILDLPIIWKLFAIFLWLNPNNAKEELKENASNFKLVSALKWLWVSKDKEGKTIEWKGHFKDIDLSDISFNVVKKEIKEIKAITWEQDKEWYEKMWQDAFSTEWIKKDGAILKFEITDKQKEDKKINSSGLKEILQKWLLDFNWEKEKNTARVESEKRKTQEKERTTEIAKIDIDKSALKILSGETIDWLSNTWWMWDYNDFKKIKITEITKNTDIETTLKTAIWEWWQVGIVSHESDYDKLPDNVKTVLKKSIEIVKEFLQTWDNKKLFYSQTNIWDIINNSKFKEFIENKKSSISKRETELIWDIDKQNKFKQIQTAINGFTWNLSQNPLDLWSFKKQSENKDETLGILSFDPQKQEIKIWDKTYSFSLKYEEKPLKISELSCSKEKVECTPENTIIKAWIEAKRMQDPNLWLISKDEISRWIFELMEKWTFSSTKKDTVLNITEKK